MAFPLAGIGVTADGLRSLEAFFANLPEDCGIAFALAPHLEMEATGALEELLDGAIAGAFANIDEKQEEVKLRAINQALQGARRDYVQLVIERVPEPLLVLDGESRAITANSMFLKMFKVSAAETEGQLLNDLGNRQWNIPILRELLEKVLSSHVQFQEFMVEHDFPGIGRKQILLNARMIDQENHGANMVLLALEDITESVTINRE